MAEMLETEDAMGVSHKTQEESPSVLWAGISLNKYTKINFFYTNQQQLENILGNDTIHLGYKQFKMPKCKLTKCTGTYMRKPCENLMDILKFQMSRSNIIRIPIPSTFSYKLNAISIRSTEEFFSKLTKSF